jgi:3',5'-nucleoside bisphosphate phosphatase
MSGSMSLVDLHLHSTASDGKLSPHDVVKMASDIGLQVMALTDHDTIEGIIPALEAVKASPDLTFIPGVEISTEIPNGEAHILGYFIDYKDTDFTKTLEKFRISRLTRGKKMVDKLASLGFFIDWKRVQEIAGDGVIGRPHIARAMIEKGYINKFEDAFRFIGHDGPAYVPRDKMTPEEAVELIIRAKGLPALAHPFTVKDPEAMVIKLKKVGLVGLEVYYKDNTPEQTSNTLKLAEKYGLIATGGTDYHAMGEPDEVKMGGVEVPIKAAKELIVLRDKLHR